MTIPEIAKPRAGQGIGVSGKAAGVETQRDNATAPNSVMQPAKLLPALRRCAVVALCRSAAESALNSMREAQTREQFHRAAWMHCVCIAMACRLTDASGMHPQYLPKTVATYGRMRREDVRLARPYVARIGVAADEAAKFVIASGTFT